MKRVFCALLCAAMLFGMSGCGDKEETVKPGDRSEDGQSNVAELEPHEVTFTDDLGRQITMPRPRRVAVLIGSFADVWKLAGGTETIVAAAHDAWTQFELGLDEDVADLGPIKEPNMELLLASEPDFVIGSTKTAADVNMIEVLDEMGIPSAMFNVSSFEDYLRMLDVCTQITGARKNYETYGTDLAAHVEAARARADGSRPTVLYVRATGSSCKVKNSQNTVLGEMLADMDCVNIADSQTGLLENLSMETILAADPDHIFIVLQGSDPSRAQKTLEEALLSNPAWESLTAVQQGRLHFMDEKLYSLKPNVRWGEAYEQLADILYPDAV